jgi:type II secretory pathway pseudopilin PulG
MTTTPRPNAVEAAKQGNPKAIEILLNQALQSHGHTAKVIRNEAALRILVEGAMVPDQTTIASLIETGLSHLDLAEITPQVQLYGQQLGQSLPAWEQAINLGADDLSANIFSFDTVTVDIPKAASEPTVRSAYNSPQPSPTASSVHVISSTPDMPKNYLIPSILLLILSILPLSIVPIVYSTQVAGKYDRGDYEGAELASSRAKLWCQINAGIVAVLWTVGVGIVVAALSSVSREAAREAQEREVTDRLALIMRSEQSYYLENSRFAPNLSSLGVLPATTKPGANPKLKDVYTYTVTLIDAKSVQITAIPKRKDLHSFTTGVFLQGTGDDASLSGMTCRSMRPTMMAVKVPLLTGGQALSCAVGSQPVTNGRSAGAATDEAESESSNDGAQEDGLAG